MLPLRLDPERSAIQVIPALERHDMSMRSVDLTWGEFMPLHGGDCGSQAPSSSLSAVHTSHGRHFGLTSLSGDGIGRLSAKAAQRLLTSLLSTPDHPRRRGVTALNSMQPPGLLLYLTSTFPPSAESRCTRRRTVRHRARRLRKAKRGDRVAAQPRARHRRQAHGPERAGDWSPMPAMTRLPSSTSSSPNGNSSNAPARPRSTSPPAAAANDCISASPGGQQS